MNEKNTTLPNHKSKPYGGAWCVEDLEQRNHLFNIIDEHSHALSDFPADQFLDKYVKWFPSTHDISGLDTFDGITASQGTTETFDKWYQVTNHKRLRLLRGEYFYHQMAAREVYRSFKWIEDGPIEKDDVVIISCPFADTGNIPDMFVSIIDRCENMDVPVLVDMAYINLARGLSIDLSPRCIKVVTTSLSKVFPVPHYRIGMRLTKGIDDDLMIAYQQNGYVNQFSCGVGYHMMQQFPADHTFRKYRDRQQHMCVKLSVEPSSCVLFGIDRSGKYGEYSRGSDTNRLCFRKQFTKR
jgi:hypothetical protein